MRKQGYEELRQRLPGVLVVRADDFASVADVARRIVTGVPTKLRTEDGRVHS